MAIIRDFQEKYFKLIDEGVILALLGPRRAGKSTFVEQYLSARPDFTKIYFNFDELSTREEIVKHGVESLILTKLTQEKRTRQKDIVVFIDEVQKEPKVFDQIKLLYDKQKKETKAAHKRYKFVLTGSASLDIQGKLSESLAGRVDIFRIHPFTLQESARIKNIFRTQSLEIAQIFHPKTSFQDLLKRKSKWNLPLSVLPDFKSLINEILIYGSLPETLEINDTEAKQRYLLNYRDTYLEKDIRVNINIGDLSSYSNLLTLLASQTGSLIVKKDLKEKVGIAYNTLERYLSILKATYVLLELEPYIFSASKRLVKSSKNYFFDNGILALLTGFLSFNQLITSGLIGSRFENLVINELIKKLEPYYPVVDFYFWRSSGGKEVDLVVDLKEKIIPCEIKWTDNIKQIKTTALINFLADYKKAHYGVVIYNGDFFMDEKIKIIYLPIHHLLYF